MAINVDKIISDALLELCEEKSLHKITIQDIIDTSGVSRQTFYNHFADKLYLIQYTYEKRIISDFTSPESVGLNYYDCVLRMLNAEKRYLRFMKPACEMTGQNCLVDYMFEHSLNFDHAYMEAHYGKPLTREQLLFSDYHSFGTLHMRINWILGGCKEPPEELARTWLKVRTTSLNEMFFDNAENSPFTLGCIQAGVSIGRD